MDPRDRQREFGNWWDSFDERAMVLTVDELGEDGGPVDFPAVFIVCDLCGGKGSHVNPSIDAHGISGAEMYDDPDFAEDYFRGVYDVTCYRCNGSRVVPSPDRAKLEETATGRAKLEALELLLRERADYLREVEAERRMGA